MLSYVSSLRLGRQYQAPKNQNVLAGSDAKPDLEHPATSSLHKDLLESKHSDEQ